jgi:spermidine/putrescine transport system ATP-binding protein
MPKSERHAKAQEMLRVVGLDAAFHKLPHQLSGGQRQRAALARALIVKPAVLLLDEPLGALDLKLRRQMQDELKTIQKRVGTAFIHVTHDQEEAMALADHIVVMNAGRVEDQGPPEQVYGHPATKFSATFMGESTILDAKILNDGRAETALGLLNIKSSAAAGKAYLAIRPEHVRLGGSIPATVREVVYQGSFKRVIAIPDARPDVEVLCRLSADTPVSPGTAVMLDLMPEKIIILRD